MVVWDVWDSGVDDRQHGCGAGFVDGHCPRSEALSYINPTPTYQTPPVDHRLRVLVAGHWISSSPVGCHGRRVDPCCGSGAWRGDDGVCWYVEHGCMFGGVRRGFLLLARTVDTRWWSTLSMAATAGWARLPPLSVFGPPLPGTKPTERWGFVRCLTSAWQPTLDVLLAHAGAVASVPSNHRIRLACGGPVRGSCHTGWEGRKRKRP